MNANRLADYLDHIRDAAREAIGFVDGMSRETSMDDVRTQRAVITSLVIVGEAASKLMDAHPDFVAGHPETPWRSMRGMRNRMAHGYFDINLDLVWDTVQQALPALLDTLPQNPT